MTSPSSPEPTLHVRVECEKCSDSQLWPTIPEGYDKKSAVAISECEWLGLHYKHGHATCDGRIVPKEIVKS